MRTALLMNTVSQTSFRSPFVHPYCEKRVDFFGMQRRVKLLPPHLSSSNDFSGLAHNICYAVLGTE
jgi:hypothetical protein